MKRLIAAIAVAAAPLFVLGAAAPAEAHACKCKPGHHAKAAAKKPVAKSHVRGHHQRQQHHARRHGDGLNTYGWQRQKGHGHSYGHGPGYGYVGEPNREGPYVRQYSSVDVQTSHYDSGWRETATGAPVPSPHGHGVSGYSHQYDSGWVRPGGAGPCPQPGAVMCLPPGHPPVGPIVHSHHDHLDRDGHYGHPHDAHHPQGHHGPLGHSHGVHHGGYEVSVQPDVFYGGLAGGVSGPESYGGFPTGGGVVFGSSTGGSVYSSARADAYAAASAYSRAKVYGGRRGYKKPRH